MKLFAITILFALAFSGHAAIVEQEMPTTFRLSSARKEELRRKLEAAGGCNANVCFAIDGSGSINATAFTNEKNFVLDVVSVIAVDQPVELAAVQYSTSTSPISPLTVDDRQFVLAVDGVQQLGGLSFVVGGINYCFSQLYRRRGEANKIVLLGDGKSNIGSSAIARANLFRKIGGKVCAVGAGFPDDTELLAIAGGNPDLVFEVDDFLDVLALELLIEDLVSGICGVKIQ